PRQSEISESSVEKWHCQPFEQEPCRCFRNDPGDVVANERPNGGMSRCRHQPDHPCDSKQRAAAGVATKFGSPFTKRGCVQPGTEMAWKFGRSPGYSALTVQLLAKGRSHEIGLVFVGRMGARPG